MTEIWGPNMWMRLHYEMQDYKNEADCRRKFNKFLGDIPCEECRTHTVRFCESFPPNFQSKRDAEYWAFCLHNNVNHKLQKTPMTWGGYIIAYNSNIFDLPYVAIKSKCSQMLSS